MLETLRGNVTQAQITSKYGVHSTQIHSWKKQFKKGVANIFRDKRRKDDADKDDLIEELYKQIGQQKVELDWLKKKNLHCSVKQKRSYIDPEDSNFSIARQCNLLGLARSSYYHQPHQEVDELKLILMKIIDEEYTRHPFIGTRRMTQYLINQGYQVNRKRIQSLYQEMGIEAVYPKPNLSRVNKEHSIYPYLLRGKIISACDQVWSTDITYIRLSKGFIYLMAIIDWYSRYVLDWQISITLDADFCIDTLQRTLRNAKKPCEIFNTDQGSQFTSNEFIEVLKSQGIKISMDGRGRALDNIFVERLWRSVKYECIYLKEFDTVMSVDNALHDYFEYYNYKRFHQSLEYKTPAEVYLQ